MKESSVRKAKVSFVGNGFRFVSFDELVIQGEFLCFNLNGETELSANIGNVLYFEAFRERGEGWKAGE